MPLLPRPFPQQAAVAAEPESPSAGNFVTLVDIEGFYGITPYERIVAGPHDFTVGPTFQNFPLVLGEWHGSDLPITEDIRRYINPDHALHRVYSNAAGEVVYLSLFGSKGPKTFSLFEHTPLICFPANGWTVTAEGVIAMPVGSSQMFVRQVRATLGTAGYAAMYWYIWESTDRNAEKGVTSVRVYATSAAGEEAAFAAEQRFLQQLFNEVLAWRRA
jgi:hypothetical protein